MSVFLGVDGGGTKTSLCLLGHDGRILAASRGPSMYAPDQPAALVRDVLEVGLSDLLCRAGLRRDDITYAFIGIPTYGESSFQQATLDAAPRSVLGHDRYTCDNDMVCGWAGSLGLEDGISVVSGTGSIAYGELDSRSGRAGGWGPLIGDEGSAYWVGRQALRAVARMIDTQQTDDPLRAALAHHLGITSDFDLLHVITVDWKSDRSKLASLAPLVNERAESGSAAARGILERAAASLAELVRMLHVGLGFAHATPVPVSWSGGLFNSTVMRTAFTVDLEAGMQLFDLRRPLFTPVVGAALYAARAAGQPIQGHAITDLARTSAGGCSDGEPLP